MKKIHALLPFSILMTACLVLGSTFAASKQSNSKKEPTVPPVMYEFLGQLTVLQPYISSEKAFIDPIHRAKVSQELKRLSEISKRLNHQDRLKTDTFRISAEALQNHLNQLSSVYDSGRTRYAWRMLRGSLDGCGACHAQVPQKDLSWQYAFSGLKGTSFEKAEFHFAVRQFDEAWKLYDQFLKNYPTEDADIAHLETAIRRKLVIAVRLKRDPALGIKTFEGHLKNTKLPSSVREQLQGWIQGLREISKRKYPNPAKSSVAEMENFAERELSSLEGSSGGRFDDKAYVHYLKVSGILYEFTNRKGEAGLSAKLLYYLALCDTQLNNDFFFSLAQIYLRQCIKKFPKDPTALRCYTELEEQTLLDYTGSAGMDVPADAQKSLDELKKMLPKPER